LRTLIAGPQVPWAIFSISAARSPMTTHGAMMLPVVMRGIMEPSAVLGTPTCDSRVASYWPVNTTHPDPIGKKYA